MSELLGTPEKWFDELMANARTRTSVVTNVGSRRAAGAVLSVLEENKDGLISLGRANVMEFLGMVGRGEKVRAQEFFIENTEDPDALIKGMEDGADAINEAPDMDWTKVALSIITGLGEIGARTAMAFLIGLI